MCVHVFVCERERNHAFRRTWERLLAYARCATHEFQRERETERERHVCVGGGHEQLKINERERK